MSANTATRTEIVNAIGTIETATKSIGPDRKALVADAMERRALTFEELRHCVETCVEEWEGAFFPPTAKLLGWARSKSTGPIGDPTANSVDSIIRLEREIATQTVWLRRFEDAGDEYHSRCARVEIERAQYAINNRLRERRLPPRYVAPGVEDFGAVGAGTQSAFGHWTESERQDDL